MNFRTLLPGTFKGNIRIRKLWLHHNPLRWVEQNLIVCLSIFHHMQHFYKCILVFKKSPLCSHLSMLPTLYSSPWPFHHLRPDQNKMMLSIWPLWIRSKKWRKNAIINHQQHHHYQRHNTITRTIQDFTFPTISHLRSLDLSHCLLR